VSIGVRSPSHSPCSATGGSERYRFDFDSLAKPLTIPPCRKLVPTRGQTQRTKTSSNGFAVRRSVKSHCMHIRFLRVR
jgi:hypothetical protein